MMLSTVRRIIKIGERSVGITIPKEWLPVLGLNIGSNVEVSLGPGFITVKPLNVMQPKALLTVRLKARDIATMARLIIAGYIEGFDSLIVDGDRGSARKAFYAVAMRLPGAIAMNGRQFTIKISVDELNTSVDEVIASMKTTVETMFELLMEYFSTSDASNLEQLLKLDDDLDRLHFLGIRTIKRTAFRSPQDALDKMLVIKSLEHIGDCLDRVSNTLLRIQSKISDECKKVFRDVFAQVSSYVSKAINSYIEGNIDMAIRILMEREDLSKRIFTSSSKCLQAPESMAMAHEATVSVYEAAEIAEVATAKLVRYSEEKSVSPSRASGKS